MLKWDNDAIDDAMLAHRVEWEEDQLVVMRPLAVSVATQIRDDTLAEQAQYVAELEACVRAADKVADWFPVWPSRRDMEEYKAARAKITLPES